MNLIRTGLPILASMLVLAACQPTTAATDMASLTPDAIASADDFLWLEDVDSERSLAWVADQNARSGAVLAADPRYETYRAEALAILTAQD